MDAGQHFPAVVLGEEHGTGPEQPFHWLLILHCGMTVLVEYKKKPAAFAAGSSRSGWRLTSAAPKAARVPAVATAEAATAPAIVTARTPAAVTAGAPAPVLYGLDLVRCIGGLADRQTVDRGGGYAARPGKADSSGSDHRQQCCT